MSEKVQNKKWSDEATQQLLDIVGNEDPVSVEKVEEASVQLDRSTRSIAAKLRQMDRAVASLAKADVPTFTAEQTEALRNFVTANAGNMTYKEIAENFAGGEFNAKQVQGKLLALELTGSVKPAEKVEAVRVYTADEEAVFTEMANSGAFIEEIAARLNKTISSVRGKALSLTRSGTISKIPAQRDHIERDVIDPVNALGDGIANMTVAAIAKAVDKTERGVKTLLTRRGINCADYNGEAKRAKAEAKAKTKAEVEAA